MNEVPPPGYRQWPPADPIKEIAAILARSAKGDWDRVVFRATVFRATHEGQLTITNLHCVRGGEEGVVDLGPSTSVGSDVLRRIPEVAKILAAAKDEDEARVQVRITLDRDGNVTVERGRGDEPLSED